jgi:hypothetical protein
MTLDDLVGVQIRRALYDKENIYLDTDRGIIVLEPFGSCCAKCFIQHVNLAFAFDQAEVTRVEDLPKHRDDDDHRVIETWGHRIHTTKGTCTIEMRVTHSGYYGGSLLVKEAAAWEEEGYFIPPLDTLSSLDDF